MMRRHKMMPLFLGILVILNANGQSAAGRIASQARAKRSDDLSMSELNALVQQQVQAIQTLQSQHTADQQRIQTLTDTEQSQQTRLTASENRIHALEHSLPSAFAQVAFTVHFSADNGPNGIHLNAHQVLQFDAVVTNIGNGYNTHTGIFTAPVPGVYSFFLTQMGTSAHPNVQLAITKQNSVLDRVYAKGSSDNADQGSGQVSTHLAAGEQVWVRQDLGDAVRGSWYTVFTGYLVQADKQ